MSERYVLWAVLEGSPLYQLGLLLAAASNSQSNHPCFKQIRGLIIFFLHKNVSGWTCRLGVMGPRVPLETLVLCVFVSHHP